MDILAIGRFHRSEELWNYLAIKSRLPERPLNPIHQERPTGLEKLTGSIPHEWMGDSGIEPGPAVQAVVRH